ncbi:hypothetical protein HanPSC8_Chr07g0305571 [Helianthus annuus]|nr:hypothetical protein HanPSC8_Chr07g0305571 [Helianthus annuus]
MDKKFVKNQDSKKVPVGPKGQPSKRNIRKGEKPMRIHKSQSHVLVLDSQLYRSAGTLHVKVSRVSYLLLPTHCELLICY